MPEVKLLGALPGDLLMMDFEVDDPDKPGERKVETRFFMMVSCPDRSTLCVKMNGICPSVPDEDEKREIQSWMERMVSQSRLLVPGSASCNPVAINSKSIIKP